MAGEPGDVLSAVKAIEVIDTHGEMSMWLAALAVPVISAGYHPASARVLVTLTIDKPLTSIRPTVEMDAIAAEPVLTASATSTSRNDTPETIMPESLLARKNCGEEPLN